MLREESLFIVAHYRTRRHLGSPIGLFIMCGKGHQVIVMNVTFFIASYLMLIQLK